MRRNACCFTGHREIPPEDREPLRAALLSEIQRLYAEKGVTEFYTGGARGFDTMAAEAVLENSRSSARAAAPHFAVQRAKRPLAFCGKAPLP